MTQQLFFVARYFIKFSIMVLTFEKEIVNLVSLIQLIFLQFELVSENPFMEGSPWKWTNYFCYGALAIKVGWVNLINYLKETIKFFVFLT